VDYDLTAPARERYTSLSAMRWLLGGLGEVWSALLAWFVLLRLAVPTPDTGQSIAFPIVFACLAFAISLSVWAVWMGRLGPVSLRIYEVGLELRYKSGRTDLLPWDSLSGGLILVDYSGTPYTPALAKYTQRLWEIRRWNRPPSNLSKEAFGGILEAARQRRLVVTSQYAPNSRWGPCHKVRITGK
jgi:hypothetical protein